MPRHYALFGGTFDPFHAGHLAVARAARAEADEVIVIPGGTPPHRAGTGATSEERWLMAVLATLAEPGMRVARWETDRAGAGRTYAIDTLAAARAALGPDARLSWVIGADAMALIPTWKDVGALFAGMGFLVVPRDGHGEAWVRAELAASGLPLERVGFVPMPEVDVSATEVRAMLASGGDVGPMLAPEVVAFARKYRPYRSAAETTT